MAVSAALDTKILTCHRVAPQSMTPDALSLCIEVLPSKVLHATKVAVPSHAMVIQVANYLSISVMVVSLTWDDL